MDPASEKRGGKEKNLPQSTGQEELSLPKFEIEGKELGGGEKKRELRQDADLSQKREVYKAMKKPRESAKERDH